MQDKRMAGQPWPALTAGNVRRQAAFGPGDITILTPYTGQLLLLRRELSKHILTFYVRTFSSPASALGLLRTSLRDRPCAMHAPAGPADQCRHPAVCFRHAPVACC